MTRSRLFAQSAAAPTCEKSTDGPSAGRFAHKGAVDTVVDAHGSHAPRGSKMTQSKKTSSKKTSSKKTSSKKTTTRKKAPTESSRQRAKPKKTTTEGGDTPAHKRVREVTRDVIVRDMYSGSMVNSIARGFGLSEAESKQVIRDVCDSICEQLGKKIDPA